MRIRFRVMIGRELDERGITTPVGIGEALGMSLAEAAKLLTRHQWREGDLLLLEAAAARLGLQVPGLGPWRPWARFRRPSPGDKPDHKLKIVALQLQADAAVAKAALARCTKVSFGRRFSLRR